MKPKLGYGRTLKGINVKTMDIDIMRYNINLNDRTFHMISGNLRIVEGFPLGDTTNILTAVIKDHRLEVERFLFAHAT